MYRRPPRKKELLKRILIDTAMVLTILSLVTVLIFVILGYRLDLNNGKLERSALLQFNSDPAGARVVIDGEDVGIKTADKYTVDEGVHTFIVKKDGYEQWQKTLNIKAGTLTWLNYIRLIPVERPIDIVANYKTVRASLFSSTGNRLAVQADDSKPSFQVVNLTGDEIKTTDISLSTDLYTSATGKHTFSLNQWDASGRHLLIKHTYSKTKIEWLTVDTQDVRNNKNITKLLDIAIESPVFAGNSGNILFAITDGDIRKLDLSAGTISRLLVPDAKSFKLYGTNVITYVGVSQSNKSKLVAGLYRDGDSSPHVLRTVDASTKGFGIATTRYFNDDFVAISEGKRVDILSGDYPAPNSSDSSSLTLYDSFEMDAAVDNLSFSPEGYYLLAQAGVDFTGYDIEHRTVSPFTIEKINNQVPRVFWFDDNHLWSSHGDKLSLYDFDGTNAIVVNKMLNGQGAALSTNEKYIYSVDKSLSGGYQLQRVKIIL